HHAIAYKHHPHHDVELEGVDVEVLGVDQVDHHAAHDSVGASADEARSNAICPVSPVKRDSSHPCFIVRGLERGAQWQRAGEDWGSLAVDGGEHDRAAAAVGTGWHHQV